MSEEALWPDVLGRLVRREELPGALAERALGVILAGEATDAQIAAFALTLRAKGETPSELASLVRAMRAHATPVSFDGPDTLVDTCGTGGDRAGTVNVSTMAAIVVAAAGATVAKHGNRAASSQCGSADVLEALGVVIDLGPGGVQRCLAETGIAFCFAPVYHPAMRFAGPARRELGVATTFNVLGPLANPVGVRRQAVGVAEPALAATVLGALELLGSERALVFYGHDGLDELTTTTTSTVLELRDGERREYLLDPTELGLARVERAALAGGDSAGNAAVVHQVFAGRPGPVREIVLLNAAAGLVAAGLTDSFADGIELGAESPDDGSAADRLDAFVRTSVAARESGDG
jgi:anthranilate phosphoribosyltransferase